MVTEQAFYFTFSFSPFCLFLDKTDCSIYSIQNAAFIQTTTRNLPNVWEHKQLDIQRKISLDIKKETQNLENKKTFFEQ